MKRAKIKFWIILLINFVVIIGCIVYFIIGRNDRFWGHYYSPETKCFSVFGNYVEQQGYYVDETFGTDGLFTCGPYMELEKGIYEVTIYYESHGSSSRVYAYSQDSESYADALKSDNIILNENETVKNFTIWVNKDLADFEVQTMYDGRGSLLVKGITIVERAENDLHTIFTIMCALLLIDIAILLHWRRKRISKENVLVAMTLSLIIAFASSPLLKDGVLNWATDLNFILMRIEGLKDGILSGSFPVRIQPNWLNNYGYATSIFYGDLFLILPAVLRIFGFSVQGAWQCYVFGINIATCLISYFCLKGMFCKKTIALIGTAVYTLSTYRLALIYILCRGGMLTSYTFLPLIAYGVYLIYKESNNRKSWILLSLGMTGIINSHLLTCEITAIVLVLTIVFTAKAFFKKGPFFAMVKAVLMSVLLNVGFLVPMLSYMGKGLKISSNEWGQIYGYIQKNGTDASGYFSLFKGESYNLTVDLPDLVLILCIVLFVVIYIWIPKENISDKGKEYRSLGIVTTAMSVLLLIMGTRYFPWDWIEDMLPFARVTINSIQFPSRFYNMVTVLMVISLCCSLMILKEYFRDTDYKLSVLVVLAIAGISSMQMLSHLNQNAPVNSFYDTASLDDMRVCTEEYLPVGAEPELYTNEYPILGEGIIMTSFERDGLTLKIGCINEGATNSFMELPLVYYADYQAVDANGAELSLSASDNFAVVLTIPENYAGDITVRFKEPISWTITFWISVLSAVALIVTQIMYRQRAKKTVAE